MATTAYLSSLNEGPEDVLRRRAGEQQQQQNSLETNPTVPVPAGSIPNTPLTASAISFSLGAFFILGLVLFFNGGSTYRLLTGQLGFFIAAWSIFHWAEFAVTAGWNREKCSVDCEYIQYHCSGRLTSYCSLPARKWRGLSHSAFRRYIGAFDNSVAQTLLEVFPLCISYR